MTLNEMVDNEVNDVTNELVGMIEDVAGYNFSSADKNWYNEKIKNILKNFYNFVASVEG